MGGQGEAVHSGNFPTNWKDKAVSWKNSCIVVAVFCGNGGPQGAGVPLLQNTIWVLSPAVVPGNGLGPWMKVPFPFPRTPSRGRGRESCLLVCCWGDKCFVVTVVYLLTKQGHKHGIFTEEPLEVKSWPSYFTRQWRNQSPESGINLSSGTVFSTRLYSLPVLFTLTCCFLFLLA